MYTAAELDDEFEPVDADECVEMEQASELGYSMETLVQCLAFDEATIRHHLEGHCSH